MNSNYDNGVQSRSFIKYYIGIIPRLLNFLKNERAVRIARKRGASIGKCVVIPLSLAKKANANLSIGDHTSIQTDMIDMRASVQIGNHVIIGSGVQILTESHNIDSPEWELKTYGLTIEDYAWLATNAFILPSCRNIGYGAVIGGGSLCVSDIKEMSIVSGNPAKELRKRKCVHSNLVVESLLGGDYLQYIRSRRRQVSPG